jgi:Protein of unknown function (DUF3106)
MTLRALRRASALLLVASGALLAGVDAHAQAQAPMSALAAVVPRNEAGVRWQNLTPTQRQALAPLEHEWPTIDPARKQKWLVIAGRLNTLPPAEQARISARMTEWARLSPAERGEMRLRYQEARQVPAPDRTARWEAYQKLPTDEKQQFAARAASSAAVAPTASRLPSSRESTQGKANVVSNPALAQPPRPVAPTIVQASPGATTHLITRPTSPPAHQQSGMPKIAATPEFVNRSTLLPQRGPQAAAVVPVNMSTRPNAATPAHPNPPAAAAKVTAPTPPPR